MNRKDISIPLNCWRSNDPIVLEVSRGSDRVWLRSDCTRCESKKGAKVGSNSVLNFSQSDVIVGAVIITQPPLQLSYPDSF